MNMNDLKSRIGIRRRRVYPNSFLDFWANLFNISGNLYEYEYRRKIPSGLEQDAERLARDWRNVGNDMRSAAKKVMEENQTDKEEQKEE